MFGQAVDINVTREDGCRKHSAGRTEYPHHRHDSFGVPHYYSILDVPRGQYGGRDDTRPFQCLSLHQIMIGLTSER